jgi:hypothetical protein
MNPKNKCSQSHSSQFKSNNKCSNNHSSQFNKKTNQKLFLTKTQSPNLEVQTMDLQMNLKNKCFQNHSYNSKPIETKKKFNFLKILLVKTKSLDFEIQNNGCNEPQEQVLPKSIIPTQKQQ